jgi:hypothetical protein
MLTAFSHDVATCSVGSIANNHCACFRPKNKLTQFWQLINRWPRLLLPQKQSRMLNSKATATSCCVHKPHPATASTFVVTRIYHKPDSKATTRWVSEPPSLFWSPPPLLLPANSCRVGVKYRIKCLHWKSPACIKERLSTSAHTSQSPTEKGVYLYKVLE